MEGGGHQDSKPESLSSTSSRKDAVELKEAAVIIDLLEESEEEEFDYGESEDDEESGSSVVLESHERDRSMINACARPQRGLTEHVETDVGKKRIIRGSGRTTSSGKEDIGESVSDGSSWRLTDREDDDDFVGQGMDENGRDLLHNVPSEEEEDYAIKILQKIGTCRWCRYPVASEMWLRAFLYGDGAQDEAFWTAMRGDTYECLACLDAYTTARDVLLEYIRNQHGLEWRDTCREMEGRLQRLESNFMRMHLEATQKRLISPSVPDSLEDALVFRRFGFALLDILTGARACLADKGVEASFVAVMDKVATKVEMTEVLTGRRLPGLYRLLNHPNENMREWARTTAKAMGRLGLADLRGDQGLHTVLGEWVRDLEEACFAAECQVPQVLGGKGGSGWAGEGRGSVNQHVWKALRTVLELLEEDEAIAEWLLSEYPILPDMVFAHARTCCASFEGKMEAEKDRGGSATDPCNPPTPTPANIIVVLNCFRVLLEKMKQQTWSHDEASALPVFDWLCHNISIGAKRTQDTFKGIFKSFLDLVPPFLRSLRHALDENTSNSSIDRDGQGRTRLINKALQHLVRIIKSFPPNGRVSTRHFLERSLCQILRDAYDPSLACARTWPLRSIHDWAPVLATALKSSGTLESASMEKIATDTVHLILEQHRLEAEDRIEDALQSLVGVMESSGSVSKLCQGGDDDFSGKRLSPEDNSCLQIGRLSESSSSPSWGSTLLCGRLMHELTRRLPLTSLPPLIRDDLFKLQAAVYLRPVPSTGVGCQQLDQACNDQTAAFESLLERIVGAHCPSSSTSLSFGGTCSSMAVASAARIPPRQSSGSSDGTVGRSNVGSNVNPYAVTQGGMPAGTSLSAVVPLLLVRERKLTASIFSLLVMGASSSSSTVPLSSTPLKWEYVLSQLPSSWLRGIWRGVNHVLKDLLRVNFLDIVRPPSNLVSLLPAFFALVLELLERHKRPDKFGHVGAAPPTGIWWRFVAKILKKGYEGCPSNLKDDRVTRRCSLPNTAMEEEQRDSILSPSLLLSFFKAASAFLSLSSTMQLQETHSLWLELTLDWGEDETLSRRMPRVHCAVLDFLRATLEAFILRHIPLKQPLGSRIDATIISASTGDPSENELVNCLGRLKPFLITDDGIHARCERSEVAPSRPLWLEKEDERDEEEVRIIGEWKNEELCEEQQSAIEAHFDGTSPPRRKSRDPAVPTPTASSFSEESSHVVSRTNTDSARSCMQPFTMMSKHLKAPVSLRRSQKSGRPRRPPKTGHVSAENHSSDARSDVALSSSSSLMAIAGALKTVGREEDPCLDKDLVPQKEAQQAHRHEKRDPRYITQGFSRSSHRKYSSLTNALYSSDAVATSTPGEKDAAPLQAREGSSHYPLSQRCNIPTGIGPRRTDDDFEIFRQLKHLTTNAPLVAREFHRHVLKWNVADLMNDSFSSEAYQQQKQMLRLDEVPLRYRDSHHYLETWQPLLLEETRSGLGRDMEESLAEAKRAARSQSHDERKDFRKEKSNRGCYVPHLLGNKSHGKKRTKDGQFAGEIIRLSLQHAVEDLEGDGLSTLTFSIHENRPLERLLRSSGSGQAVFVLFPTRSNLKGTSSLDVCMDSHKVLEEGEVVEDIVKKGRGNRNTYAQAYDGHQKVSGAHEQHLYSPSHEVAMKCHAIAVLLSASENGDALGRNEDKYVFKFRVAISQKVPGTGGLHFKQLKVGSDWSALGIGGLTTAAREFAALREVLGFRLAPRLLQGGKECEKGTKEASGAAKRKNLMRLTVVSEVDLRQIWRDIEKRYEAASNPSASPLEVEELSERIRSLRKIRVSRRLLSATDIGRKVKFLKKNHKGSDLVRAACGQVLKEWRAQVRLECACYDGEVTQSVNAVGLSQQESSSQTYEAGTGDRDQQKENVGAGSPIDVERDVSQIGPSKPPHVSRNSLATETIHCPSHVPLKLWKSLQQQFNAPQLKAISASCFINAQAVHQGCEVTLLQGPPGTGKTRCIMGLLSAIMHSRPTGTYYPSHSATNVRPALRVGYRHHQREARILVCAPSNGAIDEITMRLQRTGLLNAEGQVFKPTLVRLGVVDPDAEEEVKTVSLESQLERALLTNFQKKEYDKADAEVLRLQRDERDAREIALDARKCRLDHGLHGRNEGEVEESEWLRKAEQRQRISRSELYRAKRRRWECLKALEAEKSRIRNNLIRDAKIILSTLSTAASSQLAEAVTSTSRGFGTVVIDEAGQAVEPSTLIPLRYGCRNLILVGDPRQLPATVMSPVLQKYKYDRSLFERLEKGGHPVHLLRVQYRMRPPICRFPSQAFYHNKLSNAPALEAAEEDADGDLKRYDRVPYFGAYRVFNVSPAREIKRGNAISNIEEAIFAVQLIARFRVEFPDLVAFKHMAVITPYRAQVRLVEEHLRVRFGEEGSSLAEVSTIDGFQGREKEVIIFSCVRANPQGGTIGFLADERRMNVGLTRARRSLFVLCHRASLWTDRSWRAFIEDAEERQSLVDTGGRDFDQLALMMLQRISGHTVDCALPQGPRIQGSHSNKMLRQGDKTSEIGTTTIALSPSIDPPSRTACVTGSVNTVSGDDRADAILKGLLTRCESIPPLSESQGGGLNTMHASRNGRRESKYDPDTLSTKNDDSGHSHFRPGQLQQQISAQDLAMIEEQQRNQEERKYEKWKQEGVSKETGAARSASASVNPQQLDTISDPRKTKLSSLSLPSRTVSAVRGAYSRAGSVHGDIKYSKFEGKEGLEGGGAAALYAPRSIEKHKSFARRDPHLNQRLACSSPKRSKPTEELVPLGKSKRGKADTDTTNALTSSSTATSHGLGELNIRKQSADTTFTIPRRPDYVHSSARTASMSSYVAAEAVARGRPAVNISGDKAKGVPLKKSLEGVHGPDTVSKKKRPSVSISSLLKNMPDVV